VPLLSHIAASVLASRKRIQRPSGSFRKTDNAEPARRRAGPPEAKSERSLLRRFRERGKRIRSFCQHRFRVPDWRRRFRLCGLTCSIVPHQCFRNRWIADSAVKDRNLRSGKLRLHVLQQLISPVVSERHVNRNLNSFEHSRNIRRISLLRNADWKRIEQKISKKTKGKRFRV
jgi:hypothetical protein